MGELAKRAATGAAYVVLTLAAAWSGPVTTSLLFLPVCAIAAAEMHRLAARKARGAALPVVAAASVYGALALAGILPSVTPLLPVAVIFIAIIAGTVAMLRQPDTRPAQEMGTLLLVIFLVAVPFGLIPALMRNGPEPFIGFMLLLWTNDTGAYLVGRAIGRTGLLRRVSPKKTVEGLVGGIILAMAAGFLLARTWPLLSPWAWMTCAAVVALAATLGDLLESALKRDAGVKDSGNVLPGHGGILDRFDGFLLALPAMLITVELLH